MPSHIPVDCSVGLRLMNGQKQRSLANAFAYCLFLDALLLTVCRLAVLEILVKIHGDSCKSAIDRIQKNSINEQKDASLVNIAHSAYFASRCRGSLVAPHIVWVVVLICITAAEMWLANSVRRYGKTLPRRQAKSAADPELLLPLSSRDDAQKQDLVVA